MTTKYLLYIHSNTFGFVSIVGLDYYVSAKIISPSNAVIPNIAVLYACRSFAHHIVVRTHRLSLRPRLPREGDAVLVNGLNLPLL